ncbi:MAG: hypothetical protein M3486_09135, partial [Actinomycetota bacterium]|nr:hypothetical protein [Actinomycetota bacterium]
MSDEPDDRCDLPLGADHDDLEVASVLADEDVAGAGDHEIVDAGERRVGAGDSRVVQHGQALRGDVEVPDAVVALGGEVDVVAVEPDALPAVEDLRTGEPV